LFPYNFFFKPFSFNEKLSTEGIFPAKIRKIKATNEVRENTVCLPYVVSIDFWQYKVEVDIKMTVSENFYPKSSASHMVERIYNIALVFVMDFVHLHCVAMVSST